MTFTVQELAEATGVDGPNLRLALARYAAREPGAIARVSRKSDFFLIVPPEHRGMGAPPVEWWLDDLMAHLALPYYVGLLSAAAAHGSSHFAVMETQVVTSRWLRPLEVGRIRLRFFQKAAVSAPVEHRQNLWSQITIAAPETTILDLLVYRINGIEQTAMMLSDLVRLFRKDRLVQALDAADDTPSAQRLGFLLQRAGQSRWVSAVASWLVGRRARMVDLDVGGGPSLSEDRTWHVRVNSRLAEAP